VLACDGTASEGIPTRVQAMRANGAHCGLPVSGATATLTAFLQLTPLFCGLRARKFGKNWPRGIVIPCSSTWLHNPAILVVHATVT
jgi:hypothetical protein